MIRSPAAAVSVWTVGAVDTGERTARQRGAENGGNPEAALGRPGDPTIRVVASIKCKELRWENYEPDAATGFSKTRLKEYWPPDTEFSQSTS